MYLSKKVNKCSIKNKEKRTVFMPTENTGVASIQLSKYITNPSSNGKTSND